MKHKPLRNDSTRSDQKGPEKKQLATLTKAEFELLIYSLVKKMSP